MPRPQVYLMPHHHTAIRARIRHTLLRPRSRGSDPPIRAPVHPRRDLQDLQRGLRQRIRPQPRRAQNL
jgi:hypothetical protein